MEISFDALKNGADVDFVAKITGLDNSRIEEIQKNIMLSHE